MLPIPTSSQNFFSNVTPNSEKKPQEDQSHKHYRKAKFACYLFATCSYRISPIYQGSYLELPEYFITSTALWIVYCACCISLSYWLSNYARGIEAQAPSRMMRSEKEQIH